MRTPTKTMIGFSAAVLLLVPATAASAGSISSGPLTLTVQDAPFFVKGTQVTVSDWCGITESSVVRQGASASSVNGIASWDVLTYDYADGETRPLRHYAQSAPPKIQYSADNYNDDCGGGYGGESNVRHTVVRVTDKKGNVALLGEEMRMFFSRWDNSEPFGGYVVPGAFSFGTGWARSACAQCDSGATMNTSKAGASATFTLNRSWAPYTRLSGWATAGHLGLVMTKGPGHGKVKLYFDGKLKATIDTNATTWKYRTYVYDFGPFTPGAHTVKIVNVGTAGRPRIDVQGIGLTAGGTYPPECDPSGYCY